LHNQVWNGAERYRRNRCYSRLDPCTAWFEVEQRDIEGIEAFAGFFEMEQRDIEEIEAWPGSTLAQPGLKWSREIYKE
jgi:hypothetical protein